MKQSATPRARRASPDPGRVLDFRAEAGRYLKRVVGARGAAERALIAGFAARLRPARGTRVIVAIPAHVGEPELESAVRSYAGAARRGPAPHFVVLLNSDLEIPAAEYRALLRRRAAELARAFARLKAGRLTVLEHRSARARMGRLRGLLADAIVAGARAAGLADPILVTNDADQLAIPDRYFESFVAEFDRDPRLDFLGGALLWGGYGPRGESRLPGGARLPELFVGDAALRGMENAILKTGSPEMLRSLRPSGANTALRLSALCAMDGYDYAKPLAEDADIFERAMRMRGNRIHQIPRSLPEAYVVTNPRRALYAVLNGGTVNRQWEMFARIRGSELSLRELAREYLRRSDLLQCADVRAARRGDAAAVRKMRDRLKFVFLRSAQASREVHPRFVAELGTQCGFAIVRSSFYARAIKNVEIDWRRSPIIARLEAWARAPR